ncbi:metal-dependent hydrolase [Halomicroarcula sp. GCM10025709]|uniref:metal-dependent hydrolase n=1 Tax=Halomicroarcula sp. GCM10025709 TaxID=3252669 RepID=UPI003623F9CB
MFAASGLAVAAVAGRLDVSPRTLLPLALVGLLSHPFGDLFTGSPPPLLYPFDVQVVTDLVVLHPDPTLHLLGAFAIELSTVWLAVYAYAHSRGQSLTRLVHPRASSESATPVPRSSSPHRRWNSRRTSCSASSRWGPSGRRSGRSAARSTGSRRS